MSKLQLQKIWEDLDLTKLEYDAQAAALYLHTKNTHSISKTIKLTPKINIDVDNRGELVGIEVLDVSLDRIKLNNLSSTLAGIKRSMLQHV